MSLDVCLCHAPRPIAATNPPAPGQPNGYLCLACSKRIDPDVGPRSANLVAWQDHYRKVGPA